MQSAPKLMRAFDHACEQGDFEVAAALLRVMEMMLSRRPIVLDVRRRRDMESFIAAHERLWRLRNPDSEDAQPAPDQAPDGA
jgi:hypothetical protein